MKKLGTWITDRNGGMHSPVNYRKAMQMLLTHPYQIGLLYHLVFIQDKDDALKGERTEAELRTKFRKAIELLCKELRKRGMPCQYKACYERDKKKRFHKHIMILIEGKFVHPDTLIHYRKGHWFTEMMSDLGLGFDIAEPKDEMHYVGGEKVNYVYVPKKAGPKLDDALVRISYLYKVRSKDGVEGQIYTASTNREPKNLLPISDPLPGSEETNDKGTIENEEYTQASINEGGDEGTTESLNPSFPGSLRAEKAGYSNKTLVSTGHSSNTEAIASQSEASTESNQFNSSSGTSSNQQATETKANLTPLRSHLNGLGSDYTASDESAYQIRLKPRISPFNAFEPLATMRRHKEGARMTLTTAQNYIGMLYERCVDQDMDTEQVRQYLLEHGVPRTPGQVDYELNHVYAFAAYAATHQPKTKISVAAFDKAIDRS